MSSAKSKRTCPTCQKQKKPTELITGHTILPATVESIIRYNADWSEEKEICSVCLNGFRANLIEEILKEERGKLSDLEKEVVDSIRTQDLVTENPNREFEETFSLGDRLADRVAEFGGSWKFIICFGAFLMAWMGVNSVQYLK